MRRLFEGTERRDAGEVLGQVPRLLGFESQRGFVRDVLTNEVGLRPRGTDFGDHETPASRERREALDADGSPSRTVSAGYRWTAGTELIRETENA